MRTGLATAIGYCIMCFGIAQPRPTSAQGKGAQSPIVYTLAFEYLQGCETGKGPCKPTVIVRSSIDQGVTLIFPSGGTESDVYLYGIADTGPQTSDYGVLAYITKGVEKAPRMLRHDKKFHSEGVPVLDVSGLPDGEYRASIVSCGLGGSFLLKLSTAGH